MSKLAVSNNSSILCKNKVVTDEYILKYQTATSNAVESILNMGLAVKEVYYKSKNGELNSDDLQYFCQSVGLDPKSSTFRKYKCIGEKAAVFRQYLEQMPKSFSTLYAIATLDADTFDRLNMNGSISPALTEEQLKKLANKSQVVPARNRISVHNPNYLRLKTLGSTLAEINRFSIYVYADLTEEKQEEVTRTLYQLQERGLIRFDMPDIVEYINEDSDELKIAA